MSKKLPKVINQNEKLPAEQPQPIKRELSVADIRGQVNKIQEVMKAVMKQGIHFGVIPGCGPKPTLLKPGAEKIAMTFMFAPDPKCEDLSTPDEVKYRVIVNLLSREGIFLGAGIGECSSSEDKYMWRKAICDEEYEMFKAEGKTRLKYKKDKSGKVYIVKQVRVAPADVANTIVKIAKKRAYIDAILTVTAASDIFTQDIEDMPPEYTGAKEHNSNPAPPQPKYPQSTEPKEEIYKFGKNGDDAIISQFQREYLEKERKAHMAETGIQKSSLDDCEARYCKLHNIKGFRKSEMNELLKLMASFDAFAEYYERICENLIEKENTQQ